MRDPEMRFTETLTRSLFLLLLSAGLILGACGRQEPPPDAEPTGEAPAEAPVRRPTAAELAPEKFQIRDPQGEVVGFVNFDADVIRLVRPEGEDQRLVQTRLTGDEHRYNERGVGPASLVEVDLRSFVENAVVRSPYGEFRYRVELRADRALVFDDEAEGAEPYVIRRAQDNFLRINRGGESLGSVLINDKGQVRVKDDAGELVYKLNGVENFTTAFGLLLLPEVEPIDQMVLLAELHLLERLVSAGG